MKVTGRFGTISRESPRAYERQYPESTAEDVDRAWIKQEEYQCLGCGHRDWCTPDTTSCRCRCGGQMLKTGRRSANLKQFRSLLAERPTP